MTPINFAATRRLERVLLGVALALCACGAVLAQNAPASDEGASAEISGALKEIVVTATRHEESLSKVPVSVSAYTQETMDQKGMKDFTDIVRFTPGVSIDQTGTNAISIRGISSSGGAGTTGIYIDDTPIQMRSLGFNPDDTLPKTFDLDRVEVLRGPQGTLFGAGSEGGTVRYILTQPSVTKDSTYARSEVSFTQYGEPSYEAGVAHGGPIIDGTLGFRASAWFRRDGGWIDRVDPTSGAVVDSMPITLRHWCCGWPASGSRSMRSPSRRASSTRTNRSTTSRPTGLRPRILRRAYSIMPTRIALRCPTASTCRH